MSADLFGFTAISVTGKNICLCSDLLRSFLMKQIISIPKHDFISSFTKFGIPSLRIFCRIQNFFEMPDPEYESATCSVGYLWKRQFTDCVFLPNFSSVSFCNLFASRLRMIFIPVLCVRKGGFVLRQRIEARNVGWAILDVALSPDGRHLGRWSGR